MIKGPKKTVHVLMSVELYEQLKALAEATGRSLSAYIRHILKLHLRPPEDCT